MLNGHFSNENNSSIHVSNLVIYLVTNGNITNGTAYIEENKIDEDHLQLQIHEEFFVFEFKKLIKNQLYIEINILTVGSDDGYYFTQSNKKPCDILRVLHDICLIRQCTSVISYTNEYSDGFVHISHKRTQKGFIMFDTIRILLQYLSDFDKYLELYIFKYANLKKKLYELLIKLTTTIYSMIYKKNKKYCDLLIKKYTNIFNGTCIPRDYIMNILKNSIQLQIDEYDTDFIDYQKT